MLTQPLLDKLSALGLRGFRAALEEQFEIPHYAELAFEERLGLLIDIECTRRADNRLQRHIRSAHFALPATIEDLDLSVRRGLKRAHVLELAQSAWVRRHLNILILGATGTGKTYLTCALGNAACRANYSVRYERTSRLLQTIELAHADGSYAKLLRSLARTKLLIFDDWLRDPLTRSQARDLLEVLDDRYGHAATIVATQIPVADWHPVYRCSVHGTVPNELGRYSQISDPTLADAILDRLIHNAYRLELQGVSMRKTHSRLPATVD